MKIPPRNRQTEFLVTKQLISFSYLQIGIIQAFCSFTIFFESLNKSGFSTDMLLNDGLGFEWDDKDSNECFESSETDNANGCASHSERNFALRKAQTAYLASIVMCQIGCGIACKTRESSIFKHGFSNMVFNYGLVQETVLIVLLVYVPGLQYAFQTEDIDGVSWAVALPFAFGIWGYDEMRKAAIMSFEPGHWFREALFY
jgi:sodium/potassium-transporting ATPase subunit alpha